jgi:hypothetical protein
MFIKDTFVHTVYFWLKNPADIDTFVEGVKGLAQISHLRDVHVGVPVPSDKPIVESSYHVSLLTLFNSKADHDAYQVDPIHESFLANYVKQFVDRVMVTDSVDA